MPKQPRRSAQTLPPTTRCGIVVRSPVTLSRCKVSAVWGISAFNDAALPMAPFDRTIAGEACPAGRVSHHDAIAKGVSHDRHDDDETDPSDASIARLLARDV